MYHIEQKCECEYTSNFPITGFALVYVSAAAPDILMVDTFHCWTRGKKEEKKMFCQWAKVCIRCK